MNCDNTKDRVIECMLSLSSMGEMTDLKEKIQIFASSVIETMQIRSACVSIVHGDTVQVMIQSTYQHTKDGIPVSPFVLRHHFPEIRYAICDANITCQTIRKGDTIVLEEFDRNLDRRFDSPADFNKVAYFIPLKTPTGKAIGVLATGSTPEMRDAILERIQAFDPAFQMFAVILNQHFINREQHGLNDMEIKVVRMMVVEGLRCSEISYALDVSQRTVENWVARIYEKLNCSTPAQMGALAMKIGVIPEYISFVGKNDD